MSILSVEQLGHSFNESWLFKELNIGINRGQRLALVGINGSGKSTLLKLLAEKMPASEGKVVKEKGLIIGYLEQDPDFSGQTVVRDFVYNLENEKQQLILRYEELANSPQPDQSLLNQLAIELSHQDAWEYSHKIKTILQRLSIQDMDRNILSLSGGQKKRLALAKLLIEEPDIFILDEPTNHLDIEMIEWLENYLTTGQKTVFMVTHDRYFLDNVCTGILELAQGRLYTYNGNYSYFLEKKSEREADEASSLKKNRNLLKKELEWMRRMPKARGTKSKARIEAFHELKDKTKGSKDTQKVQLSTGISRQGKNILELSDVSFSYDKHSVIQNLSYVFKKGDRIGVAGKNGSGKSTLLNLLTGNLQPTSGHIKIGETTVYGYYKQDGLEFDDKERVIDVVKNVAEFITIADGSTLSASQLLTHFLFPPAKQHTHVHKLSGGERKRLQLMRVLMRNPNFLILDEPTNDLDIETLNILEDFLEKYSGVLMLVSHDRYLIDKLTEQLFILEDGGQVNIFNGNYSEYRFERDEQNYTEKTIKKQPEKNLSAKKNKLTYKEEKELETIEAQIERLESQINSLTEELTSINEHDRLTAISLQIQESREQVDVLSTRWIELLELKENS